MNNRDQLDLPIKICLAAETLVQRPQHKVVKNVKASQNTYDPRI